MFRLDVWLDVACVFKTRSEAQRACKGGKVLVNGHRGKPHRELKLGDQLDLTLPGSRKRRLVVVGLAETHMPKATARTLYDDVTPPQTAEERELRELFRRAGPRAPRPRSAPDKRDRRALRRLKGG